MVISRTNRFLLQWNSLLSSNRDDRLVLNRLENPESMGQAHVLVKPLEQ